MDVFKLSRQWFDWSFENPELIKPNHTALYFFIIEQCNRLGWKEKFGLPTTMAKEAIGIKSYNTYIETLNDLVVWGFITMIEKSKNQYSSNIVALSNFDKAHNKALDKALIKHASKQSESTGESINSIDIQETIEPETRNNSTHLSPAIASTPSPKNYKKATMSEIIKTFDRVNKTSSDFEDFAGDYALTAIGFYELFDNNIKAAGGKATVLQKAKGTWIDDIRQICEKDGYNLNDLRKAYTFLTHDLFCFFFIPRIILCLIYRVGKLIFHRALFFHRHSLPRSRFNKSVNSPIVLPSYHNSPPISSNQL